MRRAAQGAAALLFTLLVCAGAAAQPTPDPRDALIEELKRRIEVLEAERAPSMEREHEMEERHQQVIEDLRRRIDALETQRAAVAGPADAGSAEEDVRALERALTREGALVLAPRSYEIEPRIEYSHRGSRGLGIVNSGGAAQIAAQDVKQDRFDASIAVRAGLGARLQFEARVPYAVVREDRSFGGTPDSLHDRGAGDIELQLTRQLTEARADKPILLGTLLWRAPTGRFRLGEPSPGRGFHTLQPALTLVKRDDPIVFLGTLSYAWTPARQHEGSDVNPGDALGLKLAALLAASPQTSVRAGFEVSRAGRTTINGAAVPGSDASLAALQIGFGTLLSRRTLLDVQFSAGLTPDSPHYTVTAAVPVRFR